MTTGEYLVTLMLAVFVLFGLASFIAAPIVARRFYRDTGFVDHGKSLLEIPSESVLLTPIATSHLYRGEHRGFSLEHCKAYPKNRRAFTLNKVTRKYNQSCWSITHLKSENTLPEFCLLPLSEAATVSLLLDDPGVDLSDDKEFENRYYLRTDHPALIKQLMTGDIRNFLLARELISVECINNSVIIKRIWPAEKLKARLTDEMDCATDIVELLAGGSV